MLVINHKGNTPQQRFYSISVKGNNNANKIRFVVNANQSDVNLVNYVCNLKVQNKEHDYLDLIILEGEYDENLDILSFDWLMPRKSTEYRNLELQLEFIGDTEDIVWQTLIVELELSDTIKVGETATDKELSAIKQMEQKVVGLDNEVEELKEEVKDAKEIIIDNPSDYLNENGLDKIIRVRENGSVEKSYLIDKIHHESTLVKANADTSYSGVEIDGGLFKEIFGENDFNTIFGEGSVIAGYTNLYTIYYDQSNEITKGVRCGTDDSYGGLNIEDCPPNKVIRVIVGKYFEYDEQGEKVFDEHCAIFSDCFAENPEIEYREITEERQVFELKASDNGYFYFDSDGGDLGFGDTRFILYGFECGEQAHDEYKEREIGSSKQRYLPMFKQTDKLQVVYDYFLAHREELSDGKTLSCAIEGDEIEYSDTLFASFSFLIESGTFYFKANDGWAIYACYDWEISNHLNDKLYEIIANSDNNEIAVSSGQNDGAVPVCSGGGFSYLDVPKRYKVDSDWDDIPIYIIAVLKAGDTIYSTLTKETGIVFLKDNTRAVIYVYRYDETAYYTYIYNGQQWAYRDFSTRKYGTVLYRHLISIKDHSTPQNVDVRLIVISNWYVEVNNITWLKSLLDSIDNTSLQFKNLMLGDAVFGNVLYAHLDIVDLTISYFSDNEQGITSFNADLSDYIIEDDVVRLH